MSPKQIEKLLYAHRGTAGRFCATCAWTPQGIPGWRDLDDADLTRRHQAEVIATALREESAEVTHDALIQARAVITQYLSTAEKWRYDRVCWAFAIMLGEIPEDTPEPPSPDLRGRNV